MQVESRRTFKHGFVLTEAELRRIIESVTEQFGKLSGEPKPAITYTMKFRNGAIAKTASLEEVLSQENAGSGQIVRLGIESVVHEQPSDTVTTLEFINVDIDEEPGYTSVRSLVRGQSRDWVFITSTLLEERITKIRRFALNQFAGEKGPGRSIFSALIAMVMVTALFGGMLWSLSNALRRTLPVSASLEAAWKSGQLKDPVEAIVMAEKLRETRGLELNFWSMFNKPLQIVLGLFTALVLAAGFTWRYYPVYNFCWGDYLEVFQQKEARRKFVLVILLVGILVSFVGGLLANSLRRGT